MHLNQGALAELDIDRAIERISQGTLMRQIAAEYGVSKPAVYRRLVQHPDYHEAIQQQAESLVEVATQEAMRLAAGDDATAVNIARAKVDAAHKWAAARDPARWGQRSYVQVEHVGDLAERLRRARERDITPEVAQLEQSDEKSIESMGVFPPAAP